ncbi:MAG: peroxidase family protein, partial [Hyphomonadaceae bacterium]
MVKLIGSDLRFILDQIFVSQGAASAEDLRAILPNVQVPWGLRALSGRYNNLVSQQNQFGAADTTFPRMLTPNLRDAEARPAGFFGAGDPGGGANTSYIQTSGSVFDSQPRTISNLIVDQTANNPAAVAAAANNPGAEIITSPGLDGQFGTSDDAPVYYIPNTAPDFGLTVPFNTWMTFFGQFFDHGLDLVTKGGNGTIFIPLQEDDPLYVPGGAANFMVVTRATITAVHPGADGVLGTADDVHDAENTTSPFVDQNQTYSSHPSHQVFLRSYALGADGKPYDTGKLVTNRDLGADGHFGTADDVEIGGMATWAVVKAQAHDILGIDLTDANVFNAPLLATDDYGNFIRGPNGFPQVVMKGADGVAGTADDVLVEGNPAAPISLANAVLSGHQFLIDIAHSADPSAGPGLVRDNNGVIGGVQPAGTYDGELLDAHYIAGDGRVNENIGLTAVHAIFHSEHNRLVDHIKDVLIDEAQDKLAAGATQADAVAFLNEWLRVDVASVPASGAGLEWDGQRLFQAAKFATEMQYQHLVFEEFARTIQPNIDEFLAPSGYDTTIDASIVAEFAHTVYRFGHSMLTETIDRLDADFNIVSANPNNPDEQIGLIAAFLNPLAYVASGATPEEATGAIVRGVTRQAGNEIDEFVTEALRNNLVGLPLDLAAINIARGRDVGIPSLNEARRQFYAMTGDQQLKPYASWVDFVGQLKHAESLINFIAAYGTHASILGASSMAAKREAAGLLVLGDGNDGDGVTINGVTYADRLDFLNSTGAWASGPNGVTTTGLDDIDFWIGGLAERQMPFGGLLGSTFNFVFETQLEALQNGDRLYYLARTAGLNFGTELEMNSFARLIMLNTDATHLPANVFLTVTYHLEVDQTRQFNAGLGQADPTVGDLRTLPPEPFGPGPIGPNAVLDSLVPQVLRDNPDTIGPDSNYLHYTGIETVVIGGTDDDDIIISGDADDDTIYGDGGNDRLEGGYGDDFIFGGDGDDIITDMGGNDTIDGGAGNDVIHGGAATQLLNNLIFGGDGKDFIVTGEDISITFGGAGDDFIYGAKTDLPPTGNEGDDWIELGMQDGAPGDNFDPLLLDRVPGNDIFIGGGGFDEMIGEGGDDIFVGSDAQDKMDGMSGFDWVTYKNDLYGVTADMQLKGLIAAHGPSVGVFQPVGPSPASLFDRFAEVEGMSGSKFADVLYGDEQDATAIAGATALGSVLTNISLIAGLQALLDQAFGGPTTSFGAGNIILGGGGSDLITGRGGDDIIDGDKWLNVRISVHANVDGSGAEIDSFDSMAGTSTLHPSDAETLMAKMFAGIYNPGQLVATREVLDGDSTGGERFDTAVFRGNIADYTIEQVVGAGTATVNDDVWRVTDSTVVRDGVDTLMHVERLLFNDGFFVLAPGLNANPTGAVGIRDKISGLIDTTPTEGQLLHADLGTLADADFAGGVIDSAITFTWQRETAAGSGLFEDIIVPGFGIGFTSANGATFKVTGDLTGVALRVKAVYTDAHGVTEVAFSEPTAAVVAAPVAPVTPAVPAPPVVNTGPGVFLAKSDLIFVLDQIKIAEENAAGVNLLDLVPNVRASAGLRTTTGENNNLIHPEYGAVGTFPRATTPNFQDAEAGTSYNQTSGTVIDSQPRVISNLVVDQTANNPAAYATAYDAGVDGVLHTADDVLRDGVSIVQSPGLDGVFGTTDDRDVFLFENVTPDAGLTAPFNAWMTFFGQFFDHGLDLVAKGGSGNVFVPLQADDPIVAGADGVFGTPDDVPAGLRFMVLSRATNQPGPDGILGTADDVHENTNLVSPFVDQNQTYSSHPSHQVFLRAYAIGADGRPHDTGNLIVNRDLGADGLYGTGDDTIIGGMATWAVIKAQARDVLGINLTDAQVFDVPLLATDDYGNFIRGPNGFPMVVMKGADGVAGTADDELVEGNPDAPIDLTNAISSGHQFLNDIAHSADPSAGPGLVRDNNGVIGGAQPAGTYDGELLDAHYIAGDGRVNENIGLTAVHAIFHSEHNRLVEQIKTTVIASGDLAFINEWLRVDVAALPSVADINTLEWDGQRLFQAAKFGTEMQYQHLVFEEFARTIQPEIDIFFAPTQVYDVEIDAAIVAEFAHTVYRFGHSMLTETVDRLDANFDPVTVDPLHPTNDQQLGLIAAFLNPLAYAASGATPEEATGAIVRGVTRTVGNEIDEFVTEALRNNLVGLPLDLATLNIARARETGVPTLNEARRQFFAATQDSNLKPYTSWVDLVQHLKHPESVINFIAAYGTHVAVTSATTLDGKREAALLLVLGDGDDADGVTIAGVTYADRFDFLHSTGAFANTAAGVTVSGVDDIDFWLGGLAEEQTPFGGLLGSTFNFIFENQLEKLQDGDRFYYLERTAGLNFGTELEGNSFARLIMANTDAKHLPGLVFMTPAYTLEVDQSQQHTGFGGDGRDDPTGAALLTPLVIRDNPDTIGPDGNYLRYTGAETVVLGGTAGNDILIAGDSDDDTLWGDEGDDYIDGGYGADMIRGGAGDDVIHDLGGDDNIQGGDGNDVIHAGNGINLIIAGAGKDFIVTGEDANESFAGQGDDFILGSKADEQNMGGEGHDWIEGGTSDGSPGDNFDPLGLDPIIGNDVYIGQGENDKFNGEGGDDIMVGSPGYGDRYLGASGFDWATFKNDPFGVTIDALPGNRFFDQPLSPGSGASVLARFDFVEGYSGSSHADVISGDNYDATALRGNGATGSVLTNVALIDGLQEVLDAVSPGLSSFDGGNIILGGGGGDLLMGRGGNDIIDGDKWLNVRISVRATVDNDHDGIADRDANGELILGAEIDSFDSMKGTSTLHASDAETLVEKMLTRQYNPGQLQIVREILSAADGFDTAVYTGNVEDYTITIDDRGTANVGDDIVTVADNNAVLRDGVDTLMHIERLQFANAIIVLGGDNSDPVGAVQTQNLTADVSPPREGVAIQVQLVTIDGVTQLVGVTDADNASHGGAIVEPVSLFWQTEILPGVWEDITTFAAGEIARVGGDTYTPTGADVGLRLRVRAVYVDENGTAEQVYSDPSGPVVAFAVNAPATGTPTLSTLTPTEGDVIAANTAGITDGNGVVNAVFSFQWQQSSDGVVWTDIVGENLQVFVPGRDQDGLQIRVQVQFSDDAAFVETLVSEATAPVLPLDLPPTGEPTILGAIFREGELLTASAAGIADPDGLTDPGFFFIWESSADGGATWDFAGAGETFTPTDAEAGRILRVSAAFTDDRGFGEFLTSQPTPVIGDLFNGDGTSELFDGTAGSDLANGNGGNDTLNGLAGDDILNGGAGGDTLNGGDGADVLD